MSVLLFASPIIRLAAQGGNKTSSNDIAKSSSTAELERLKFYLGDWDYSEVYEKSALFPNGGRNTGSWTAQVGPQGRSIIHAFVSHGTGDNYEGIEVMTWDTKEKVYRDHSLWYDSADQWTYVGHFEGDLLVYRGEFEFDGKHVKFRSETRPRLGGGFTLDEFMSVDGGPEQKVLRGTAAPRTQATTQQSEPSRVTDQADVMERMVELSKPGENHKLLAGLAGTWEYTGKHFPSDPKEKPIEISGSCVRKALWEERYFLAEDTGQKLKMPWAEGREVASKDIIIDGYDNVKRKFVRAIIDNHWDTGMLSFEGSYDAATKTITYDAELEDSPGVKTKTRWLLKILDNDHYMEEIYEDNDGRQVKDTEIHFTRVKGR